jgi:uncharacterized protein (DUF1810 family)
MPNPPDLQRFLDAQQGDYQTALGEIKAGRKRSHWMWYIFPQVQGLGYSSMAQHYAIADSGGEAAAYLAHPTLGPRLIEISRALLTLPGSNATAVMGTPDDLKLRSSMTLFAQVPGADAVFQQVLDKFFGGAPDAKTLQLLGSA